jgi:hypothetical protein
LRSHVPFYAPNHPLWDSHLEWSSLAAADFYIYSGAGGGGAGGQGQILYEPAVTGITPTSGPSTGGTVVTVSGAHFTGATQVYFGAVAASTFTVTSDTTITATAPAHAAETVHVTVVTEGGTSATSPADEFTYFPEPRLRSSPPNGARGRTASGPSLDQTFPYLLVTDALAAQSRLSVGDLARLPELRDGFAERAVLSESLFVSPTPAFGAGKPATVGEGATPGGFGEAREGAIDHLFEALATSPWWHDLDASLDGIA